MACFWPYRARHEFRNTVIRQLAEIDKQLGGVMSALAELQAADEALKAEVSTFLADIATALQNAGSANDPAIAQVVSDINDEVAALQANDPANQQPPAPPAP